jgi:hypothetical protein
VGEWVVVGGWLEKQAGSMQRKQAGRKGVVATHLFDLNSREQPLKHGCHQLELWFGRLTWGWLLKVVQDELLG